jgi:hypothetical protein
MSGRNRKNANRQRLAYEAARIIVDQGVRELDRARRKAAERLGIGDRRVWPNNREIQEALLEQQRLFDGKKQSREVRSLRCHALSAMRAFASFEPRLVGPVLVGSADSSRGVRLHLFTDNPDEVVLALIEQGIPWSEGEEIFRYGGGTRRTHPVLAFLAGEVPFELAVLPIRAQRNPPLDPVSERPERGAGALEVARLLGGSS